MAFSGNHCLIRVWLTALLLAVTSIQVQAQPQMLEELDSISQPAGQTAALITAAELAFSENRFHDAIRLYSGLIKLFPHKGSFFLGRGMAYEMANQPEKASADYLKALEIDPQDFHAMVNLAGIYEHSVERMPEAILLYKRALELDPRPERQADLAFCIAVLEKRLRPEHDSAVGCWNLGNKQSQKGDSEGAIAYYSKAIELDPRMFQAYNSRGLLRLRTGDLPMAIEDLSKAIRLSPSLRGCLVARGMAYEMNGDDEKAKADFERAVGEDKRDPNAHYHLGRMFEKEENFTQALQSYVEATRLRAKPELKNMLQQRIAAVLNAGKVDLRSVTTSPKRSKDLW